MGGSTPGPGVLGYVPNSVSEAPIAAAYSSIQFTSVRSSSVGSRQACDYRRSTRERVPLFAARLSDLRHMEQGICDNKASAHTVSGNAATAHEGSCPTATLRRLIPYCRKVTPFVFRQGCRLRVLEVRGCLKSLKEGRSDLA